MAEQIKLWGITICSAAIIAGTVNAIMPAGALGKTLKYFLGLFLTLAIITPFLSEINTELEFSDYALGGDAEYAAASYDEAVLSASEKSIKLKLFEMLEKEGITAEEIVIDITDNGKGGIYLERIEVGLSKDDRALADKAIAVIEQAAGVEPKIIF